MKKFLVSVVVAALALPAMAQSALVTMVFLRPNVRNPFLRQRKGFRRYNRFDMSLHG